MKHNLIKKISGLFLGLSMAVGGGVALNEKCADETFADSTTVGSWFRANNTDTVSEGCSLIKSTGLSADNTFYQTGSTVGTTYYVGIKKINAL